MKNFKDKSMQSNYLVWLNGSDELIANHIKGGKHYRGGGNQSAFADGYEGHPLIGVRDYRGTWAYSAYCAGKDRKVKDYNNESK
jgi:hypothetical protein